MAISVYGSNDIIDGGRSAEGSVKLAREEAKEEVDEDDQVEVLFEVLVLKCFLEIYTQSKKDKVERNNYSSK